MYTPKTASYVNMMTKQIYNPAYTGLYGTKTHKSTGYGYNKSAGLGFGAAPMATTSKLEMGNAVVRASFTAPKTTTSKVEMGNSIVRASLNGLGKTRTMGTTSMGTMGRSSVGTSTGSGNSVMALLQNKMGGSSGMRSYY